MNLIKKVMYFGLILTATSQAMEINDKTKQDITSIKFLFDFIVNSLMTNKQAVTAEVFKEFEEKATILQNSLPQSNYREDYNKLIKATKEIVKDVNSWLLDPSDNKSKFTDLYYSTMGKAVYDTMKDQNQIVKIVDFESNRQNYSKGDYLQKLIAHISERLLKVCNIYLPIFRDNYVSKHEQLPKKIGKVNLPGEMQLNPKKERIEYINTELLQPEEKIEYIDMSSLQQARSKKHYNTIPSTQRKPTITGAAAKQEEKEKIEYIDMSSLQQTGRHYNTIPTGEAGKQEQ